LRRKDEALNLTREHLYYPEFWDYARQTLGNQEINVRIAKMLGLTRFAVRSIHARVGRGECADLRRDAYPGHPDLGAVNDSGSRIDEDEFQEELRELEPLFPDKKRAAVSWEEIAERAAAESDARDRIDPTQQFGTIDLSSATKPVGIFLMSDIHFGSPQCDYRTFLKHAYWLKTIPNLYGIFQGDVAEWAISQRQLDAVLGQVFGPQNQAQFVKALVEDLLQKLLAVCMGNHEGRLEIFGGFDAGLYMYDAFIRSKHGIYLKDGGSMKIRVGQQEYSWLMMHGDSRFGSMYNQNHKAGQLARMSFGRHDIASTGHTHSFSIQYTESPAQDGNPPRPEVLLQAGSYKTRFHEKYPHRLGFAKSPHVAMPGVILFPDTKRMIPFGFVEDLVWCLEGYNKKSIVKGK